MVAENTGSIRFDSVVKTFLHPDGQRVTALERVDADIAAGEFISLIGPSGCGKSTFLRLLAGLNLPDTGRISLDGEEIAGPGYERGLVFQDPTLFPWLNIRENVAFGLKLRGIYRQKKSEVDDFLRLVGLEGFEKAYPHQLSGGMAQRAALARALVNHPKVLLLDEAFGALDAFTRMSMQDELIRIWQKRGTTTVMVTHDVDEAVYLSDRVFVMTPRPARVAHIIPVALPRPRARGSAEFLQMRAKILHLLHFAGKNKEPEYFI